MKILAVDDNADNLVSLVAMLRSYLPGCEPSSARSGVEGIEKARVLQPDVIILDVQMPGMDGFQACRILKEDALTRHIPVIFLTARHTDAASRICGLEMGADAFLAKPVDPGELMAQVRAAVRVKRAEDALRGEKRTLEQAVAERTAALVESKALLEAIVEGTTDGIVLKDLSGRYIFANAAAAHMMGRAREEILGKSARLLPLSDDMAALAAMEEREARGIADGKPWTHEARVILKGEERTILVTKGPVRDASGRISGLFAIARDITDRARAADRQRLALEVLECLNSSQDLKGVLGDILERIKRHVGAEAAAIRLADGCDYPCVVHYGYPEGFWQTECQLARRDDGGKVVLDPTGRAELECLCGSVLRGRIDPSLPCFTTKGSFWTNGLSALAAALPEGESALCTRRRCVSEGYESVALIPLRSGEETVGLLQLGDRRAGRLTLDMIEFLEGVGRSIDVAMQRQREVERRIALEAQLLQSQKMESIGRLAGGIAHDFNNLLQVILSFAETLRDEPVPTGDEVQEILKAASRAADLTRQILAFSRRQVLSPRSIDLRELVCEQEKMLARVLGEDIDLVTDLADDLASVHVDPGQIEQVILNLAVNARDAMPHGGKLTIRAVNVTLETDEVEGVDEGRPGSFVKLSIVDTGSGMPPEVIEHIFEPFYSTKGPGKGTGLGLAVCYGIVKQHGGWIDVSSTENVGSTFAIHLPVQAGGASGAGGPGQEDPSVLPTLPGRRILFVDDEAVNRQVVRRIFVSQECEVVVAGSVKEAVEAFERESRGFDLLLCDVALPDGNGVQVADRLLAMAPGLKVVLCSGYTDKRSRWSEILARGWPFLQKPFKVKDLLRTVRQALAGETRGPET